MTTGYNVARMREILGIKQEELARRLNVKQQSVSKIERKENVDEIELKKIAEALGVSSEAIANFNEASLVTSINQQGGNVINFNPIEAIIKLYEEKIATLQSKIIELETQLTNRT